MSEAIIIFTKSNTDPLSWLIRWALPMSRFKWARASHSMILDGDYVIHATMRHGGVIRQPLAEALKNQQVVTTRVFQVDNLENGIDWAKKQIGKSYDFKGAFGIALTPDREWIEDDSWFCHELCAAFLHNSGKKLFREFGHVTDSALLLVNPS